MDNTYNKTSGDIIAVLSLSMHQQTLRNKSVEELRYIARHAFNVGNAVEMTKEELIVEIIKARAKMLEPKKRIRIRSAEAKESIRRIDRRGLNFPFFFYI